ncbi:MAG: hypothetical protein MUE48_03940 [Desulfobacterales bacterium]|jgi:hypothetical protein|nr:hypothetical protein [Desulfobacterales bacterium]
MDVQVDCIAGPTGEPEPARMRLGGTEIAVDGVVDRWLAAGHRYFKVRAADGGIYVLRHDTAAGSWRMSFFQAAVVVPPGDLPPGRS